MSKCLENYIHHLIAVIIGETYSWESFKSAIHHSFFSVLVVQNVIGFC